MQKLEQHNSARNIKQTLNIPLTMKLTRRKRRKRKRKIHLKDKALEELEDLVEQNVIFKSKKVGKK